MKKIIMLLVFSLLLIVTACSNKTTTTSNITTTGSKNSFEIINPKSNATDVDINLIIEWTKNDNATSYTVLLYEQPSNIVVFSETVNTLSIEVSDLRPNKEYKVLIKAKGNNYEESISSYFTTKNVLASEDGLAIFVIDADVQLK